MQTTTIIFHTFLSESQSTEDLQATVNSVVQQTNVVGNLELVAIAGNQSEEPELKIPDNIPLKRIEPHESWTDQLNTAIQQSSGDLIILIDNRIHQITCKSGMVSALQMAYNRSPEAAGFTSDYNLVNDQGEIELEVHLLNHHIGRIRDNQDVGKILAIPSKSLREHPVIAPGLMYNQWYALRLQCAAVGDVVHIANKYSGALYEVRDGQKNANVFDYLMAGKEVQQEAEQVVTDHLKQIGAYLAPGKFYQSRPKNDRADKLVASVIIPVNNRPEFIGTAIESVQAQTVKNIEVIVVVNGGQSDPTVDAVKSYQPDGSRYDRQKPDVRLVVTDINNIGLCLNLGVQQARGTYYIQLDSDDRLKPDAVEKILSCYNSDEHIGMVIGSYEVWEKTDAGELHRMKDIPVVTHDEWTEDNGRNNLLRINGAGAPRSIPIQLIKDMGWFGINDEPFARNYGEDYDMVLRIGEHHRIGRIYDPIYEVIRHSGGTDHSIDQATTDRNDEAKDWMRKVAIRRRQALNAQKQQGTL